jgi:hypothetical protein
MLLNPYLLKRAKMIQKFKKNKLSYHSLVPQTTIYDDNYLNLQDNETIKQVEYKKIQIQDKQTLQEKYDEITEDVESNVDITIDDVNDDDNDNHEKPPNLEQEEFILVDSEEEDVPKDDEEEDVPKDDEEEDVPKDLVEEEKDDEIVEDNVDKVIVDKKEKSEDKAQDGGSDKNIKTVYFSFF